MTKVDEQAQVLENIAKLRDTFSREIVTGVGSVDILTALGQFSECVRYLNTRRSTKTVADFTSEAEVQDLIYLMLRAWIPDLVPETPTEKVGNRYSIKDFFTRSAKTIIEVKFIRDDSHGKNVSREIYDDIENYRHNPDCEHLIFFIYDPDSNIPDVAALKRAVEEDRMYGSRHLYCHLLVS